MKLNKKACRKYADPGLVIPSGHGLLHAEQVHYIVRSAVRIIDHHRTLVLYVYPREQTACPRWVVFQCRDDFITLEQREDGRTSWRKSSFNCLGGNWDFIDHCAFYSQADMDRVTRCFKDDSRSGFAALLHAQRLLQEKRAAERQKLRDQKVLARMAPIPSLPRGLKPWIHRQIMPAYFFYDYRKGQKPVTGICTACGKEITLTGVKYNAAGTCPHCGRTFTMKSRGRRGRILDRDTVQVIQQVSSSELVVRIVKCWYSYSDDTPYKEIRENARIFVRQGQDGKTVFDAYYDSYFRGILTTWKKGFRPVFYQWCYNFQEDFRGHLYCAGLSAALDGTLWQYCPLLLFYEHFRKPMELASLLSAYLRYPQFEHLVKSGFYQLAYDLVYKGNSENVLDQQQKRMPGFLGVAAEDIPFLRELDAGLDALRIFQPYSQSNLKDRQALLLWQLEHGVNRDTFLPLAHMSAHKLIRYVETQKDTGRSLTMQAVVSEYRDYLAMCEGEYEDPSQIPLFPKNLQAAHDALSQRIRQKKDEALARRFNAAYAQCAGQLCFAADDMQIVCPAGPEDVIAEGAALNHCVGSYVERVAKRECLILFLRRQEALDEPFYTIELRGKKIVQVHGIRNTNPTPEVQAFLQRWERQVLRKSYLPAAG